MRYLGCVARSRMVRLMKCCAGLLGMEGVEIGLKALDGRE